MRPLSVEYRKRFGGGRLYASPKNALAPGSGRRVVCAQQTNRELRPFLFGHCRDYDLVNCQPELLRQLSLSLSWRGGRRALELSELESWCNNRPAYIEHVSEVHALPADEDRFEGFRKDAVKELVIRLMFGGTYSGWLADHIARDSEPRSPRVTRLAAQLAALREATFQSDQWSAFYKTDSERLAMAGEKNAEERDRSVFARIAQSEEDRVLGVMIAFFTECGHVPMALCFDGLMTEAPSGAAHPDLSRLERMITEQTRYELRVIEKPLFTAPGETPSIGLKRAC